MSHLWRAKQYAKYLSKAKNRHGIHSPFVYKLLDKVIYDKTEFPEYETVTTIRKQLLKRTDSIEITDLGAGSTVNKSNKRKIADIAKNSAKGGKWGELLYRLSKHFQPEIMIELGTSLGIGGLYQSLGNPNGKLTTFEGCPNTAAVAQESFNKGKVNPAIIEGNFDNTLQAFLDSIEKLDWAFIDGNHQKEPTIRYFEQCLQKCHNDSVLLFDDIYWSKGMAEAWENIKTHERVNVTLDLFQVGIVFLRKEQPKQHFIIRY
ncbi:MAG: class I SAM-dependent methyltransferase [Flavobacteriales bacterium]|nr:class I SAM-dependent methyltransferase [Flavobacteriales bacterium]